MKKITTIGLTLFAAVMLLGLTGCNCKEEAACSKCKDKDSCTCTAKPADAVKPAADKPLDHPAH